MKKILFQYAVILHKFDEKGNPLDSELILGPEYRLAKSEKDLLFALTREIPEEHTENPDNIQILIRNF